MKGFTSTGSAKGLVSKPDMVIEGQRAISASATAFGHSDPAALNVNPPLPGARQPFWRRRSALCRGVALTSQRSAPPLPCPLESEGTAFCFHPLSFFLSFQEKQVMRALRPGRGIWGGRGSSPSILFGQVSPRSKEGPPGLEMWGLRVVPAFRWVLVS